MAGIGGRNTKIAVSKLAWGVKLPFEQPGVGDNYAGAGPVTTYRLTPEELARYGPPSPRRDRILTRGEVSFAVENAESLERAGRMLRVSTARMKKEMTRHCVAAPEEWKESKTMQTVNETAKTVNDNDNLRNENTESCNDNTDLRIAEPEGAQPAPEKQPEAHKTRKQVILEILDKDDYLNLKNKGLSDEAVLEANGINISWKDALISLKREWGLVGRFNKQDLLKTKPDNSGHREDTLKTPTARTIAQAIALHDELEEEVESLDWLLDPERNIPLVKSIRLLLDDRRCHTATRLKQIRDIFNTLTVNI